MFIYRHEDVHFPGTVVLKGRRKASQSLLVNIIRKNIFVNFADLTFIVNSTQEEPNDDVRTLFESISSDLDARVSGKRTEFGFYGKDCVRGSGYTADIEGPNIIKPFVRPSTVNDKSRLRLVVNNAWGLSSEGFNDVSLVFLLLKVNFLPFEGIHVKTPDVVYKSTVGSVSAFFERPNGATENEVFPGRNGGGHDAAEIPFGDFVGYFGINPEVFLDIIDHEV